MAYETSLGGEQAIVAAHRWRTELGCPGLNGKPIETSQLTGQLRQAVDRVSAEAGLYDHELCASAIRQAQGDLVEAIRLVGAYRTTLSRFGKALPVDTKRMQWMKRLRPGQRDPENGQILGPSADYTLRLWQEQEPASELTADTSNPEQQYDRCLTQADALCSTQPINREARLQRLAHADEGFLLAVAGVTRARSTQAAGVDELRVGLVEVAFAIPETGTPVSIADIVVSECMTWTVVPEGAAFQSGYGLCLGSSDRRVMAAAMLDLGDSDSGIGDGRLDGDFLLVHCDAPKAAGYVEHLGMPQYVSFQTLMASRVPKGGHAL